MKLLTFLLSGPLQSWGDGARWDRRPTASMPSKSAVVGMLGCCLGYPRGDRRLRALSESIRVAVRADRPGRPIWDFQTVQNPGGKIMNSMGKPRGDTIITPKQYLQDAAFQVFVVSDEASLKKYEAAMLHPRWPVCLGRRSCAPAIPIVPRIVEYDSIEEALNTYFDPAIKRGRARYMECQVEASLSEKRCGRPDTRMDEAVRAELNQYREREIDVITVKRGDS